MKELTKIKTMKKLILLFITCLTLNSCSTDNETDNPFDGELVGTVWLGTLDDEGESYSFLSNYDFKYVGEGTIQSGTYTFDGTTGVFTSDSTHTFKIEGNKMTVEDGSSSIYIKN